MLNFKVFLLWIYSFLITICNYHFYLSVSIVWNINQRKMDDRIIQLLTVADTPEAQSHVRQCYHFSLIGLFQFQKLHDLVVWVTLETAYFWPPNSQEFLVFIWLSSEGWKLNWPWSHLYCWNQNPLIGNPVPSPLGHYCSLTQGMFLWCSDPCLKTPLSILRELLTFSSTLFNWDLSCNFLPPSLPPWKQFIFILVMVSIT